MIGRSPIDLRSKVEGVASSDDSFCLTVDARYDVRVAETAGEVESALRLRYEIFKVEIGGLPAESSREELEQDKYDRRCRHLIVVERATGRTVGTYRLNSIDRADEFDNLYSYNEFTIEDLPACVLYNGIEIGRACIAAEYRNTRVLFLLWKGLANYLLCSGKRYFFGCCSIFTRDGYVGEAVFRQMVERGHFHETFRVEPRKNTLYAAPVTAVENELVTLPSLFEMYLRIGAKVCGPPMMDEEFGTVDFFVVFDLNSIDGRYRRMFFN